MLTFTYGGYGVYIDDAGNARYTHLAGDTDIPAVANDPPASIVMLAGSILQLVATDVVKAEMRVAELGKDLRVAMLAVGVAEHNEYEAELAGDLAMAEQSELSEQLKAAEQSLQTAKAVQSC